MAATAKDVANAASAIQKQHQREAQLQLYRALLKNTGKGVQETLVSAIARRRKVSPEISKRLAIEEEDIYQAMLNSMKQRMSSEFAYRMSDDVKETSLRSDGIAMVHYSGDFVYLDHVIFFKAKRDFIKWQQERGKKGVAASSAAGGGGTPEQEDTDVVEEHVENAVREIVRLELIRREVEVLRLQRDRQAAQLEAEGKQLRADLARFDDKIREKQARFDAEIREERARYDAEKRVKVESYRAQQAAVTATMQQIELKWREAALPGPQSEQVQGKVQELIQRLSADQTPSNELIQRLAAAQAGLAATAADACIAEYDLPSDDDDAVKPIAAAGAKGGDPVVHDDFRKGNDGAKLAAGDKAKVEPKGRNTF